MVQLVIPCQKIYMLPASFRKEILSINFLFKIASQEQHNYFHHLNNNYTRSFRYDYLTLITSKNAIINVIFRN